jgi:NYN domain
MRAYCSLFIDAGYLMAAASTRIAGTSLRSATDMDVPGLLDDVAAQVQADCGLPLLRIHWYDAGTKAGTPDQRQREIAELPRVKVRLGRLGHNGEQKGVDLKLALDLIAQSRNRVAEVIYLISGDDDLSEAVEAAQELGVQVIAVVVPDEAGEPIAVSRHLRQTVDRMVHIGGAVIDKRVKRPAVSAAGMTPLTALPRPPAANPNQPVPGPRPTPLMVSPVRPMGASVLRLPVPPRSVPAYATSTGGGGHWPGAVVDEGVMDDAIRFVVDNLAQSLWRTAGPGLREELERGRPNIPAEIDRTLLNDLSNKLGIYDLPQPARFALRDAFWECVDRQ